MVVVNPEAPEPGEAVDGVAGPEIQRVIQISSKSSLKYSSKKFVKKNLLKKFKNWSKKSSKISSRNSSK